MNIKMYIDKINDLKKLDSPDNVICEGEKIINDYISAFSTAEQLFLKNLKAKLRSNEKKSKTHTENIEQVKLRLKKIKVKNPSARNILSYMHAKIILTWYSVGLKKSLNVFCSLSNKTNP